MSIQLIPVGPEHRDTLAKICFTAFERIARNHGFEPDFPNAEVAGQLISLFSDATRFWGVAALGAGRPIGSNFITKMDPVSGVGPITVDPDAQSRGVGRKLMRAVIDHARDAGLTNLRLLQDAHNQASMSLYSSLGFDWREACALMQIPSGKGPQPGVRPMTVDDLRIVAQMSTERYGASRGGELAWTLEKGFGALVRERGGRIVGYFTPSMIGHGVAETLDDAMALILHAGATTPPPMARFFCPLGEHALHRAAMTAGCRAVKVMNLMSMGEYERPKSTWMPSILY